MRVPQGTGSGFVWDEQGHIITNFHVIRGAQEALVTLGDQRSFQAQLVGDNNRRITVNLPEEQTDLQPILALDFKAYQRVEGTFKVPPGAQLKTLNVRVIQGNAKEPKAQQSLQL